MATSLFPLHFRHPYVGIIQIRLWVEDIASSQPVSQAPLFSVIVNLLYCLHFEIARILSNPLLIFPLIFLPHDR